MMEMYQIVTSYDGLKFAVENKDDEQVLNVSEYSCLKAIRSLSSPERVFVDVGANLGSYTVRLAPFFRYVYAFEPEPNNFRKLIKNIELNGLTNVATFNLALGSKREERDLYPAGSGSTLLTGFYNVKPVKVKVVPLDEFVEEADVVKIDVEGFENEVVKGMSNLIINCKPYILIEHHDFRHYKTNLLTEIEKFLGSKGYFWLYITPVHRMWIHVTRPKNEYKFLLFHHWFNLCIKNLEEGRPWYYGLPYTWWYGMNLIDFYYTLPEHLETEDRWLSEAMKKFKS